MLTEELSRDILVEALEALADGIAIYSPDNRPLYVNEVSRKRFGSFFTALENGVSFRDATRPSVVAARPAAGPAEVEAIVDFIEGAFNEGETYDVGTEDGRLVQATYHAMSGNRKVAFSIDVTEARNRERELRKARKEADIARREAEAASSAKSAFLANMSHEIRTPLNGILGMAQVLEMSNLDPAEREQVQTILESGRHLTALLNDVLDLSKIEAGKFEIAASDTDLPQLLRRLYGLWKPRVDEKALDFQLVLDSDLPERLSFDERRVQQCMSNLLSNAIKFTETGRVDVRVSAKPLADGGCMVQIDVADTGPGLDASTLARLFRPFAQADESISRRHGGSGLGLSITRRLAELMGGTATATSDPGRGSVFSLTFRAESPVSPPRAQITSRVAQQDIRQALLSCNVRVLVVDDVAINRLVVGLFLRPLGMQIVEAANGLEALAALEREAFDLVLLDMHMPVLDGPSTIKRIRSSDEQWSDVPVVAVTADAMSGDRERYLAMGIDGYLSKPLSERDLVSEINRVCGRRDAVRALA